MFVILIVLLFIVMSYPASVFDEVLSKLYHQQHAVDCKTVLLFDVIILKSCLQARLLLVDLAQSEGIASSVVSVTSALAEGSNMNNKSNS